MRRAAGLVPLLALALVGGGALVPAAAATTVTGRITFAPGAEPGAMSAVSVRSYAPDGSLALGGATPAPDGTYTLTVDRPTVLVVDPGLDSVWAPEYYGGAYDLAGATVVTPDGPTTGLDVQLDVGGTIAGRVSVPAGTDPTLWTAWATRIGRSPNERLEVRAPVAADGTYAARGLAPGDHRVSFTGPGWETWKDAGPTDATPVPVTLGRTTDGIDPTLQLGTWLEVPEAWAEPGWPVALEVRTHAADPAFPVTGDVEVVRDGAVVARATLADGVARPEVGGLPAGTHELLVRYLGSDVYEPTETAVTVRVVAGAPLTVSALEPGTGPRTGYGPSSLVTVRGTGFAPGVRVTFGGRDAEVTVLSDTELQVRPPDADAVGTVAVEVHPAPGRDDAPVTTRYTYADLVTVRPVRVLATTERRTCAWPAAYGVPASATGVFVNVTAAVPTGPGYAVVHPGGSPSAPLPAGSTVNFEPGVDSSNSAYVALDRHTTFCVTAVGGPPQRLLVDVTGYTTDGAGVVPVDSARLLDTRPGGVGDVRGPVRPRTLHTVQVAGRGGVPDDARAVLLNATTTGVTAPGNLRVFPGDEVPSTSVVNYVPGKDKANTTLVELVDGTVSFWSDSSGSAHVLLDVLGYTTADSVLTPASTPTRVLDTRAGSRVGALDGPLPARSPRSIPLAGTGPVPADAAAVVLNVTAVGPGGVGNLRVYPDTRGDGTTPPPDASSLNYVPGRDVPNQVVVALPESGRVALYSDTGAGPVHVAVDVVGWVRSPDAGR
ncbi:Ig-like domain repeat protein [Cellulomonas sp. 179-A 9B4 NHS]|uniref:IPT/TIG domain-containing protein n=1 Tax=Cellulomonas sp. 179-A 9B4 NHS TaxID=3142379 RepID=UPI00399F0A67